MSDQKTTRHWIRAYVDLDQVSFELMCEHPDDCQETAAECRHNGCTVKDYFGDMGTDLLEFRDSKPDFGRVEVACQWRGYGEDAELYLVPPGVSS